MIDTVQLFSGGIPLDLSTAVHASLHYQRKEGDEWGPLEHLPVEIVNAHRGEIRFPLTPGDYRFEVEVQWEGGTFQTVMMSTPQELAPLPDVTRPRWRWWLKGTWGEVRYGVNRVRRDGLRESLAVFWYWLRGER